MQTSLQLLGGPRLLVDGVWTLPTINRPLLLLSYLAYQASWVAREALLTLFWPDQSEAKARQNLRTLLYKSKESWTELIEVEEERIRCLVHTDCSDFQAAIARGDWQEAIKLYQGVFLERAKSDEVAVEMIRANSCHARGPNSLNS